MIRFLAIVLLFLSFGCKKHVPSETLPKYKLEMDDGIFVEIFDSTHVDENRYTANNTVFKEGTEFVYKFHHITPDGTKRSFKNNPELEDYAKGWTFIDFDSPDKEKITQVKITVKRGLQPFLQHLPDYNQSIIQFDYPISGVPAAFNSMSGVIENEKNIWMHPPRDKYFRILELNPFPFIQAPYEVGNTWTWSLEIGSGWGDKRWKTWEGIIKNSYQYEIIDKKVVKTELGEIECFEVQSTATSSIGSTELLALFSPIYGFVTLDYTNIDGSKTLLTLTAFTTQS